MRNTRFLTTVSLIILLISACKKNNDKTGPAPAVTKGYYILNEGTFNGNNTTITYYDLATSTATTDFYQKANGSSLGDTGNDIVIYGGKLYIVMNNSSYIEVADPRTAVNIKKIEMKDTADAPILPRYLVGYKNKVLVTSYDGTVAVIDTGSLAIEKFIKVGSTPEQLVVSGDKLFVANSGGLNFPNYDSTVSVIDLTTMTETQKIVVGLNPVRLATDNAGAVFVASAGDYYLKVPLLTSIDVASNTVKKSVQLDINTIRFDGNYLYGFNGYGASANVLVINPADLSIAKINFISDGTSITTAYGLNFDDDNGNIFIADAKDFKTSGEVFCFDKDGKKKFSFSVAPGISPDKIIAVKQ